MVELMYFIQELLRLQQEVIYHRRKRHAEKHKQEYVKQKEEHVGNRHIPADAGKIDKSDDRRDETNNEGHGKGRNIITESKGRCLHGRDREVAA